MIPSSISWLIKTAITQLPKQIALIAILTASPMLLQAVNLVNEDVPSTMADGNSTYTLNKGFTKVFTDQTVYRLLFE